MLAIPGYQIERRIAAGAQGEVFRATDRDGTAVAIKVVRHEDLAAEADGPARLRREAELLSRIDSPHVVRVRELVECDDLSAMVMELLDGPTLMQEVRRRGGLATAGASATGSATAVLAPGEQTALLQQPVTPDQVPASFRTADHVAWALAVGTQVVRGTAALHEQGQVHRDLKPQNVLLVDDGRRAVLTDFGLARATDLTTLTQTHALVGTLAYMAPEQGQGAAATPASDVYGLGALLHACLCGSPPRGALADGRHAARAGAGRRLRRLNPAVPDDLAHIVDRALEPDPRDRQPSAMALLADLERHAAGEPLRSPFSAGRLWRHHRRKAGIATVLLALGLGAFAWVQHGSAGRVAGRMLAAAQHGDAAAVRAEWTALDDAARASVLPVLDRDRPTQPQALQALAMGIDRAVLRVAPSPRFLAAVLPVSDDRMPTLPPLASFVPLDEGLAAMLPPGLCWVLLLPRDPGSWWAADDPTLFPVLLRLGTAGQGAASALPLALALPEPAGLHRWSPPAAWAAFPQGDHAVRVGEASETVRLEQRLLVRRSELGEPEVTHYLRFLRGQTVGAELLRHPDEPAAVTAQIAQMAQADRADLAAVPLPAQVSFWLAWRVAAFHGAFVPDAQHWLLAAQDGQGHAFPGGAEWTAEDLVAPEGLRPIDADPGRDRTTAGLQHTLGNAMEWTSTRTRGDWRRIMPGSVQIARQRVLLDLWQRVPGPGTVPVIGRSPDLAFGLRLFRPHLAVEPTAVPR